MYLQLLLSLLLSFFFSKPKYNNRPIIGILSQPSGSLDERLNFPHSTSYIASDYIQYIEQAGARALPIQYDWNQSQLKNVFKQINGILLPGGAALLWENENRTQFSKLMKTADFLIQLAIQENNDGNYFPILSICLGFEMMILSVTQDPDFLEDFRKDNNVLHKLKLLNKNSSYMFKMPKQYRKYLTHHNAMYFYHHQGLSPSKFNKSDELKKVFNITSTAKTSLNKTFIASIESNKYPFYGFQFHPEKSAFIWHSNVHLDHSIKSIKITQTIANKFVNQCRKNHNYFQNQEEEMGMLIYNHQPFRVYRSFHLAYFFKDQKEQLIQDIITDQVFFLKSKELKLWRIRIRINRRERERTSNLQN